MIIETVQTGVLGVALAVTTLCLIVALLAAAWRLLTGPTLADRVVALDLVSMLLVVFLVVFKHGQRGQRLHLRRASRWR